MTAPHPSRKMKISALNWLLITLAGLLTVLGFVSIKDWYLSHKEHVGKNPKSESSTRQLMHEMNTMRDVFAEYYDLFVDLHEYSDRADMETEKLIKQARVSMVYKNVTMAQSELPNIRDKIRSLESSGGQIVLKQHLINAYNKLETISSISNWAVDAPPDLSALLQVKVHFDSYRSYLSDADLLTPK